MGVTAYYFELMFILLNIFQPQKLMKKVTLTEILFLRKKGKKHQKTNLVVKLLGLIQEDYDADYEASRIQTFIIQFKGRQSKKLNKKLKEQEDEIKKNNKSNHSIKSKPSKQVVKKVLPDYKE